MLNNLKKVETVDIISEDFLGNALNSYVRRIEKCRRISPDEEKRLAKAASEGDFDARRRLIEANLYLVIAIAKKNIHKSNIPFIDLVQEGNIGLMYAISKYDWKYGNKFSTYATWWIRQAMFKAISEQSFCVKIPVYIQETLSKYNKIKRDMENSKDKEVSNAEIAKKMNINEEKIDAYLNAYTQSLSLDAQFELNNGNSVQLGDTIADENAGICEHLEQDELKKTLQEILSTLKEREQSVISWRFGLNDEPKRTLEEIGNYYGVTKECIRQTELRAMKKILAEAQRRKLLYDFPEK